MPKEITLTKDELEIIKDEVRFRERVLLRLKQLNGIPQKVTALQVWITIHGSLILIIIAVILTIAWAK